MSTTPLNLRPWPLLLAIALALTAALGLSLRAEVAVQSVRFGYGYGIHLVDAQGLNRMPVWINSTQSPVEYTLYPLAAPDFLRRYAADPYLGAPIDTTNLTPPSPGRRATPSLAIFRHPTLSTCPLGPPRASTRSPVYKRACEPPPIWW